MACQVSVAVEGKNLALCEKITDSVYKSECISKVSAARKDCENLNEYEKSTCYDTRARNEQDVLFCEKIRDSDVAFETSVYSCYISVAQKTNDAMICQKLAVVEQNGKYKDHHYANLCYGVVAEALKQPPLCENIVVTNEYQQKDKSACVKFATVQ